ncbi:hypothetical protein ACVBEQ_23360 [Nakamurella sp. GG22]
MKNTYRNLIASLLVAAIVVPYVGYLVRGEMPFLKDTRGMAATGLILGLIAAAMAGHAVFASGLWHRIALCAGVVTLGVGIAAVWFEGNDMLLAAFMAGIVVTYGLAEMLYLQLPHAMAVSGGRSLRHS